MNPVKIIQLESGWQAEFRFDVVTKEVVKGFGFKWYPKEKQWRTDDAVIASGLALFHSKCRYPLVRKVARADEWGGLESRCGV